VPDGTDTRDERRARREGVRTALSDALIELVEETAFKDISVDDVARAAGITRSAFYLYFRDKHELLIAAAAGAAQALYDEADRWRNGRGRPERRLREALAGVAAVYERHTGLLRAIIEVSGYDDEMRLFWRELVGRFVDATTEHLRTEQRAGRVPRELEPQATAETLVWMVERCCYVYLARGERSVPELVEALTATWCAALYPAALRRPRSSAAKLSAGRRPSSGH
jgi:AcrR family transcriptional regulator